jgi:hypothetical protein
MRILLSSLSSNGLCGSLVCALSSQTSSVSSTHGHTGLDPLDSLVMRVSLNSSDDETSLTILTLADVTAVNVHANCLKADCVCSTISDQLITIHDPSLEVEDNIKLMENLIHSFDVSRLSLPWIFSMSTNQGVVTFSSYPQDKSFCSHSCPGTVLFIK